MNYDYVTGHYFYHTHPSNQLWACEEPNEDNVQDKCRTIVQETGLFGINIEDNRKLSQLNYFLGTK